MTIEHEDDAGSDQDIFRAALAVLLFGVNGLMVLLALFPHLTEHMAITSAQVPLSLASMRGASLRLATGRTLSQPRVAPVAATKSRALAEGDIVKIVKKTSTIRAVSYTHLTLPTKA